MWLLLFYINLSTLLWLDEEKEKAVAAGSGYHQGAGVVATLVTECQAFRSLQEHLQVVQQHWLGGGWHHLKCRIVRVAVDLLQLPLQGLSLLLMSSKGWVRHCGGCQQEEESAAG